MVEVETEEAGVDGTQTGSDFGATKVEAIVETGNLAWNIIILGKFEKKF